MYASIAENFIFSQYSFVIFTNLLPIFNRYLLSIPFYFQIFCGLTISLWSKILFVKSQLVKLWVVSYCQNGPFHPQLFKKFPLIPIATRKLYSPKPALAACFTHRARGGQKMPHVTSFYSLYIYTLYCTIKMDVLIIAFLRSYLQYR